MDSILKISEVSKIYGHGQNKVGALKEVSLNIKRGEFIGIMGPSGAGKTTLLNVVSTIDKPTEGSVQINGVDITGMRKSQLAKFRSNELGFIFQDYNLLDTLTIGENIALPLTIAGTSHKEIEERVHGLATMLGVTDIMHKFPYECSGGQKQRASAIRAMIHKPSLILADEPTGALDSKSSSELLKAMSQMKDDLDATIMMVTHDAFAASYCDRVHFIKDGMLFTQLVKDRSRNEFFDQILDTIAVMGGHRDDLL